ncbi:GntR family transcriptional regulator [Miniimonas sp. S16]|uniref:GntR family transcriptional regulator n=1 Tax=Miniimonas sp. S16 TaxID=2171623 RepID=UPI001F2C6B7D|nr:GntR family transcriptional regulator [Miniimonas sp. S16]
MVEVVEGADDAARAPDAVVDGPVTKHAQLRAILLERVTSQWAPHQAIPSERELMAEFGVSRATVREAIRQLVEEQRLYRVHGKGTFVAADRVESRLHLASFTDDMRRRGLVPSTLVRHVRLVPAPVEVAAALGLAPDEEVWEIERLRLAGGAPMALERGFYSNRLLPDLGGIELTGSLYSIMALGYGLRIDGAEQTVWSELATRSTADPLGVGVGAPLMVFRRTSRASGRPVEYVTSWYRGDRYQIHMSLSGT